jgi:hypothetical protein
VGVLQEQAAALSASAAALANSAKATQAMADEMLEARRFERPLELEIGLTDGAGSGVFNARVWRTTGRAIVVSKSEVLAGKERLLASAPIVYGNMYLGGQTNLYFVNQPYDRQGRDLVILRVTGTPENGLEQSIEFLFRVLPSGQLERLTTEAVLYFDPDTPISGIA